MHPAAAVRATNHRAATRNTGARSRTASPVRLDPLDFVLLNFGTSLNGLSAVEFILLTLSIFSTAAPARVAGLEPQHRVDLRLEFQPPRASLPRIDALSRLIIPGPPPGRLVWTTRRRIGPRSFEGVLVSASVQQIKRRRRSSWDLFQQRGERVAHPKFCVSENCAAAAPVQRHRSHRGRRNRGAGRQRGAGFSEIAESFGSAQPFAGLLESIPATYYAFDLLYCDGYDFGRRHSKNERNLLKKILRPNAAYPLFRARSGERQESCTRRHRQQGLEGIIGKKRDSAYAGQRTSSVAEIQYRR